MEENNNINEEPKKNEEPHNNGENLLNQNDTVDITAMQQPGERPEKQSEDQNDAVDITQTQQPVGQPEKQPEGENKEVDITKMSDGGSAAEPTTPSTTEENACSVSEMSDGQDSPVNDAASEISGEQVTGSQSTTPSKGDKKSGGLFFKISVPILIVMLGAIAVLVFILMLPDNRADRLISSGNRLFAENSYDAAAEKYLQAIDICGDRMEAWFKAVECAMESDELSETEIFEQARAAANKLLYEQMSETDKAFITDLYLLTPEIIINGYDRVSILLEGYTLLNEDIGLKPAISDAYIYCLSGGMEIIRAAGFFEKALYFSDYADTVLAHAVPCFEDAAIMNAERNDFEEAYRLLDTYENYMTENGAETRAMVDEMKNLYDVEERLFSTAYETMIGYYNQRKSEFSENNRPDAPTMDFGMFTYDWETMLRLDGSEDAEYLAHYGRDSYIWAPEGADDFYSGIACGLYVYDTGYYFYIGEYEVGSKTGFGVSFAKVGETSFYGFEGEYKNDAPNGEGIYYKSSNYSYTAMVEYKSVILGEYIDGIEEGRMTVWAVTGENPGAVFAGEYTASAGFAPVASSLIEQYDIATTEDRTLIAVLKDSNFGYGYYMPYYQTKGVAMSALGY